MRSTEILMTYRTHERILERLDREFTLHRLWDVPDRATFLRDVGPRIRGMATSSSYGRTDTALFDALPNLGIVSSFGVGYDHVDARAAAERGIIVTNTPDVLTEEVADLAIGLLLATLRQIPQADRFIRKGLWEAGGFPLSPSLRGRTVGILGLGRIGRAIARRLEGFGVPIHYHGRRSQADLTYQYHSTPTALADAVDVLIVSTTGGAGTLRLVDATVLQALGPNGVLINVARGSVVDEPALIEALSAGAILSAGLDVFDAEPRVPRRLLEMENIVLLPHIGSASVRTRDAMADLTVDNLVSWFSGKGPITPVAETPWPGEARSRSPG